jgi:hypothetical protein
MKFTIEIIRAKEEAEAEVANLPSSVRFRLGWVVTLADGVLRFGIVRRRGRPGPRQRSRSLSVS